MSDDHDSRYANSPYDDHRYSGRGAYERDANDRDFNLNGPDYYGYTRGQVRGWTWFSWFVILSVVSCIVYFRQIDTPPAVQLPPLDDSSESMEGLMELRGRAIVGLGELFRQIPGAKPNELIEGDSPAIADKLDHLKLWSMGTYGQRLQNIVVVGDVSGPDNALLMLANLQSDLDEQELVPTAEQRALQRSLGRLYVDYQKQKFDAPSLKEVDRERLLARLDWHGRLALTPPQAPDQIARETLLRGPVEFCITIFSAFGFVAGMGVLGLIGYFALVVKGLSGRLKFGIKEGTPASGVYAETFALWLFGFAGSQLAVQFWPFPQSRLAVLLGVMFGSLLALAWPVLRGIPFKQVREDLGLTWGRAGILEPAVGIPGYSLMVPMLVMGTTITFVLLFFFMSGQGPNPQDTGSPFDAVQINPHPAVLSFLQGDRWTQVMLIVLACVAAPIVEEIMFRGVLYRHLRDATRCWGGVLSGLFSALWMSFLFAAIHPQPSFVIPALMGIACGCTFVREWRDSLWASIVVHAISNGLIFTVLWMGSK